MKYPRTTLFSLLIIVMSVSGKCSAQQVSSYHLTRDNGLPSNRVYGMITDRLGYLWICTDKGVARYNGYGFRYFTMAEGLPTDDVWELMEDRVGRIWLLSISDEIGFIRNNQYHAMPFREPRKSLYPNHVRRKNDGIIFFDAIHRNRVNSVFYDVINDSFKKHEIFAKGNSKEYLQLARDIKLISAQGKLIFISDSTVFEQEYNDGKLGELKYLSKNRVPFWTYSKYFWYSLNDGVIFVDETRPPRSFTYLAISSGKATICHLNLAAGDNIKYIYIEKDRDRGGRFFVCSGKEIIECYFDTVLHVLSRKDIAGCVGDTSLKCEYITTIHKNDLWNCVGTHRYGAWLNYSNDGRFDKVPFSLNGYRLAGQFKDSLRFWIHPDKDMLAISDMNFRTHFFSLFAVSNPVRVVHYAGSVFLICGTISHLFDVNTHKLTVLNEEIRSFYDALVVESGDVYFVGGRGLGKRYYNQGKPIDTLLSVDRYDNLLRVKSKGIIIAYNKSELCIVDEKGFFIRDIYDRVRLSKIGIRGLENVCADTIFGNIFLKGHDNIVALDPSTGKSMGIFQDLKIKDATDLYMLDGRLAIAWRYGVAVAAIRGVMDFSDAICIPNPKSVLYNRLLGSYIHKNKFFLSTDAGFYSVDLPRPDEIARSDGYPKSECRIVAAFNDTAINIGTGDSLVFHADKTKVDFDVINPRGNGKLKLYYSHAGSPFYELEGNSLDVSKLGRRGQYLSLAIYAADDSWRSNAVLLHVYMEPPWWRKSNILPLIILGLLLMTGGIIALIAWITRRLVLRSAEKRQAQIELELRSIYAQINPHFIFNTLNSALLLISKNRMDEAYSHVSKFSRLLRSYLRSSRNKYVSVAEEATNLGNYIELQQARFRDRFVYDVIVDQSIRNEKLNIPSLLIQPFVENAINHGLLPMQGGGRLVVSFSYDAVANIVECIIDDNGIGREQSKQDKIGRVEVRDSYGDLIIGDLVRAFNKYEKMNVHISYYDKLPPGTGTVVTIAIKNPRHES